MSHSSQLPSTSDVLLAGSKARVAIFSEVGAAFCDMAMKLLGSGWPTSDKADGMQYSCQPRVSHKSLFNHASTQIFQPTASHCTKVSLQLRLLPISSNRVLIL